MACGTIHLHLVTIHLLDNNTILYLVKHFLLWAIVIGTAVSQIMWLAVIIMIDHHTHPIYIPLHPCFCKKAGCTYKNKSIKCAWALTVCTHCTSYLCVFQSACVCASVHVYAVVHVCVPLYPAGGKQCELSWGRSRLQVPGEDVILSDWAHRDRQTHRSLTHSLPHWFKCHEYYDELQRFTTAFLSSNYHSVNISIGACGYTDLLETKGWRITLAATASIVLFVT